MAIKPGSSKNAERSRFKCSSVMVARRAESFIGHFGNVSSCFRQEVGEGDTVVGHPFQFGYNQLHLPEVHRRL